MERDEGDGGAVVIAYNGQFRWVLYRMWRGSPVYWESVVICDNQTWNDGRRPVPDLAFFDGKEYAILAGVRAAIREIEFVEVVCGPSERDTANTGADQQDTIREGRAHHADDAAATQTAPREA